MNLDNNNNNNKNNKDMAFTKDEINTMWLAIDNIETANKDEMKVIQTIHNLEVQDMVNNIKYKLKKYIDEQ